MTDAIRIVEVEDEREPLADATLAVIGDTFPASDRHSLDDLRSELAERRLGMLSGYNFHLLGALDGTDEPVGAIIGSYLNGVNAGFITYLAVRSEHRGHRVARKLRPQLLEAFRADAHRLGRKDPKYVLGEVRRRNPWLKRLVRTRGAIPFDLEYYHPGMRIGAQDRFVLYRQPMQDARLDLSVATVRRILYAIYRRVYRVRYPLHRDVFADMLAQLDGRDTVGIDPEFAALHDDFVSRSAGGGQRP